MKKTLITAIACAFAAVSFAAQTPAKPAASDAGQSANSNSASTPKVKKHHTTKKSTKPAAKSTSATPSK